MQVNPIQLFDAESSTFTYILAAPDNQDAVIIDPVDRHVERDLAHLARLGLRLTHVLETHVHADHLTSAGKLRALTGAKACVPSGCGIPPAEVQLQDGDLLRFGAREHIAMIHTPGHTAGSMCYLWRGNLFTGDTLLIDELRQVPVRHPDLDLGVWHLGGTRIPGVLGLGVLVTMDAREGADLLEIVRPRTTVPVHYDDYGVFTSPLSDFLAEVERRLLPGVRPLARGATLPLPPA